MTGRLHPRSDVELAVLLDRAPASPGEEADLVSDLQALLPGYEVDVVILNRADPLLLKQTVQSCRLLYGSPRRLHELGMYAFKRYQDHRRFLAMEREYVEPKLRAFARGR